jgi:hypothetical protein
MPSFAHCTKATLLIAVLLTSACASVSVSDLSSPHYGYQVLPHFDASVDPDPVAVANGLYAPRTLRDPCYSCSSQSQLNWAGWAP